MGGRSGQHLFRQRRGVGDIGRQEQHLQALFMGRVDRLRQSLVNIGRLDMPAFAHGQVDAVQAQLFELAGHAIDRPVLKTFGEGGDLHEPFPRG